MVRHRQTAEDLLDSLSPLETDWKDDFAAQVIGAYDGLEQSRWWGDGGLGPLFDGDFDVAVTLARLFLEKSKDEFASEWNARFPEVGLTKSHYKKHRAEFLAQLDALGLPQVIDATVHRRYTWQDILTERLKAGRGSAIKGQTRGRAMEDFVEGLVAEVFGSRYDCRCSFTGANGVTTEKSDFAVPDKDHPQILIEVKAFGATGSKLTDVLGDVTRILKEKRSDTTFLLVTDGVTWRDRQSDFRDLVDLQNRGEIYRIYTKAMRADLLADLRQMKAEKGL